MGRKKWVQKPVVIQWIEVPFCCEELKARYKSLHAGDPASFVFYYHGDKYYMFNANHLHRKPKRKKIAGEHVKCIMVPMVEIDDCPFCGCAL